MTKTHIHRALIVGMTLAAAWAASLAVHAAQIGTGTITGSGSSPIIWNDVLPGVATGTINGVKINARVVPLLNMVISTGTINLGDLNPSSAVSGSISLEIGTNAANGVNVTARSTNAGLSGTTSKINSLNGSGSYKFLSSVGGIDSGVSGYTHSGTLNAEVVNATTEHVVYTTNRPEKLVNTDDATFTVSAKPDAETAAGDYTDTVVFTVVGNF